MEVAATEQAAVVRWRAVGTLWNDLSVAGTARRPVEVDGFTVVGIKQGKIDRKSTRLNSSHGYISYAVFCLKKKKKRRTVQTVIRKASSERHTIRKQRQ